MAAGSRRALWMIVIVIAGVSSIGAYALFRNRSANDAPAASTTPTEDATQEVARPASGTAPPATAPLPASALAAGTGPNVLTLPNPNSLAGSQPGPGQAPAVPPPELKIELPAIRLSKTQTEFPEAHYVGQSACAECHGDYHASCLQTTHGQSFGLVDAGNEPPDGEFVHEASGRRYRVYRKGEQLRHREFFVDADGETNVLADWPMKYAIGSGHLTISYLVEMNGFLTESPVTWYTSRAAWGMSPGYENYNSGFSRPVYIECLRCHTGQTQSLDGGRSRLQITAMTIDCERCHGPGSRHVELQAAGQSFAAGEDAIINPQHLPREQAEDVCALCHLQGESEALLMGRSPDTFQAGNHLADFRIDYAAKQADESMKIVGHVEQLHQSRCYQASPDMTCTTCHDPHHRLPSVDRAEFFRGKCISCHQPSVCGLPEPERVRQSAGDICQDCHMPSTPTDIPHVAAHHHRIGIFSGEPPPSLADQLVTLVPIQDVTHLPPEERQRCLGVAYLALSRKTPQPQLSQTYLKRAHDLLAELVQQGVQDAETLTALAQTYLRREPQTAIRLAELALARGESLAPETEVQMRFALSDSHVALRQTSLAIPHLQRLVELRQQAGDWFLLGVCQFEAGNVEAALTAARRAAEIRPDIPNHHLLLAELYARQNQPEEEQRHRELASQLAALRSPP